MIRHSAAVHRGALENYLASEDIISLPSLPAEEWQRLRRRTGRAIAWRFCTLRNLVAYRGRFAGDAFGFAWGGIYRTLLVGPIVATSYRNEGLFRSHARIEGTSDFFRGGFLLPASSAVFREIVRLVNLRHHVAGVVAPQVSGGYRVVEGYEADYAYVATAFVESVRRGLALCGLPAESSEGRRLASAMCTILYQLAGATGLTRIPRDLDAHNRFRDAYDQQLRDHPASSRLQRMAQEIARRIVPQTAALARTNVADHIARHIDAETRAYLFPEVLAVRGKSHPWPFSTWATPENAAGFRGCQSPHPAAADYSHSLLGEELERERKAIGRKSQVHSSFKLLRIRSAARSAIISRPDVAALDRAYRRAAQDNTDDRLIGAILLHMLDGGAEAGQSLEVREVRLAAGESLIRQGDTLHEMYVVVEAAEPLTVVRQSEEHAEPHELATLSAPTILGEIGMWRRHPAIATVLSRKPNRVVLLVIDQPRFDVLRHESGFRAAAAAEVQRRLALNASRVGTLLADTAATSDDARVRSIAQLFRYLTGDSHVALDQVVDLPEDATPMECVEALRKQVADVLATENLPQNLAASLQQIVLTLG